MKTALITGVTGQDGPTSRVSFSRRVHGPRPQASCIPVQHTARGRDLRRAAGCSFAVRHALRRPHRLHESHRIIQESQPDEIYNLAAQSHVQVSFETPEYTGNSDALGTLRILEALRILGMMDRVRFYQASTSEMYGKVQAIPQSETTPFYRVALRRGELLRALDHGELPRGLRHSCSSGILFNTSHRSAARRS